MSIVAIIGAAGGTGTTTIAAHLASAIAEQDKPVLCFDFCPTNVLRLHFGALTTDRDGFAAALLAGQPWQETACTSASGVRFLPFGTIDDDLALETLGGRIRAHSRWLEVAVADIDLPDDTIVICDCPRLPAALRNDVLSAADLVLVVSTPDPLAISNALRLVTRLQNEQQCESAVLLNHFEAARALDRDIQRMLRRQHARLAVPIMIHRDEALREALAHKQTVFDYAPASQAAHEFAALATWTMARTGNRTATA